MGSNAEIVYIEYPQEICSPIFVVEEFSGLFPHPSTFLNQISIVTINNVAFHLTSYND